MDLRSIKERVAVLQRSDSAKPHAERLLNFQKYFTRDRFLSCQEWMTGQVYFHRSIIKGQVGLR